MVTSGRESRNCNEVVAKAVTSLDSLKLSPRNEVRSLVEEAAKVLVVRIGLRLRSTTHSQLLSKASIASENAMRSIYDKIESQAGIIAIEY